jgi:hypothetical protein
MNCSKNRTANDFCYLTVTGENAGVYEGININFVMCIVCVNHIVRFEVDTQKEKRECLIAMNILT